MPAPQVTAHTLSACLFKMQDHARADSPRLPFLSLPTQPLNLSGHDGAHYWGTAVPYTQTTLLSSQSITVFQQVLALCPHIFVLLSPGQQGIRNA